MKTRVVFLTLLLTSAVSLPAVQAQTKRKPKAKATTPTPAATPNSEVTDKTRARRAGQTTPVETETQAAPKSETKLQSASTLGTPKTESEKATTTAEKETNPAEASSSTPAANQNQTSDEFAVMRDQIDAATTAAEKITLELKLVDALIEAGKRTDAISELHSIVDTDVFDPQGFYNVGNSFARLGDTDGAVQAYRKAIDQKKGRYSRAYNNIGVVMLRVGRWDESYDALIAALKLENFRYPEASYNLGRLYAARGQNDLAAREWKRVLVQNPDHKAAAEALARIGVEDRVVVDPNRVIASKPVNIQPAPVSAQPTAAKVRPSVETKPVSQKVTSTKSAPTAIRGTKSLAIDQESYDLLQRARTATEKGNTLDAIGNYQRLLSRQGGYFPPANLEVGFALMSLKRYDEALGNLQLVANRDGGRYPIAFFHLARVYELQGNFKTAEELFSKTASLFGSQNAQFLLDVSRVREKKGDFKGALEAMEQYLALLKQQGQEPVWSDERLTSLRQKVSSAPQE